MTRRGSGEGSIWHDRKTGYWRASIELGFAPGGTRRRWTAKARRKADLLTKVEKARVELASTGTIASRARRPAAPLTVREWLTEWLTDHVKPTAKPTTFTRYEGNVRLHIVPTIGDIPLTRLEPGDVRRLLNAITAGGHAPTSRSVHRTLHAALEGAVVDEKVDRNVAHLVRIARTDATREDSLSVDEAKAILATSAARAASGDPDLVQRHAIDATRLLTGLRPQEILGIEPSRVDWTAGTLDVSWQLQEVPYRHGCTDGGAACGRRLAGDCPSRQLDVPPAMEVRPVEGRWCLTRPKTTRSRRPIPLSPALLAALRAHRSARGIVAHPLLFTRALPNGDVGVLRAVDDLQAWRVLCRASGVERTVDRYIGRHTTASLLGEIGVDPDVITALLGHSARATTSIYKHQSDPAMRAAMSRLEARLGLDVA